MSVSQIHAMAIFVKMSCLVTSAYVQVDTRDIIVMFHQTSVKEMIVKMELPAQMVLQIIHVYVLQGSKEHFVKRHQVKQIIICLIINILNLSFNRTAGIFSAINYTLSIF